MKKILNIVMFFFILAFTLVMSLLSEPSVAHAQQPIRSADYITGAKSETVVLISNNNFKGKIFSRQKDNSNDCSFTTSLLKSFSSDNNLFEKEIINFNKANNNYLSNNEQNIHKIRAP